MGREHDEFAMPTLIFTQPEFANQACELFEGTITIGRSSRNMIIIEEDSVSGEHADFLINGDEVIVREKGSRNGVFVDGVRVQAQAGVNHLQSVRFGNVETRLEIPRGDDGNADDSTSFTAIKSYQDFLKQPHSDGGITKSTSFPVRIRRQQPGSADDSTLWLPRPEEAPRVVLEHAPTNPAPAMGRSVPAWVWIILALGIVGVVVRWAF